ncbi:SDR family oxidoreductase [Streptomyces sp. SID8361]|uniref:SDR family oxidoreductase n=1 Tax=Streptomyces sp. MnatMP-M27 TaxID=1839768 RepID=UPI00081D8E74|nr:SDR family oxidoreductase [Streptomyces sp. MnatMP-M27]MYU09559.1 SDR family oxidoreductase [Streptomyces sp. SID8361]SCF63051.1 NADP-dependent 3-hydroxy acid dehydrogenase YdfG [Streptomyces sp. MnatMP-M27]
MTERTWFITGINSGFGRQLSEQILAGGGRVAGTVRRAGSVDDLKSQYGDALWIGHADVTDAAQIRAAVDAAFAAFGRIDVVVANAGYGLFGAAEEFTDAQVEQQISTNLLGSIWTVRAALPHLRAQGGGRIIQFSSVAGLIANAGGSIYHASKWGVEGFAEALAEEVAPFGIEVTIVEPGGARTSFAHGSLQLAEPMAAAVIATLDQEPAPLRLVLGSDSYAGIVSQLQERLAQILPQQDSAARTDADD